MQGDISQEKWEEARVRGGYAESLEIEPPLITKMTRSRACSLLLSSSKDPADFPPLWIDERRRPADASSASQSSALTSSRPGFATGGGGAAGAAAAAPPPP